MYMHTCLTNSFVNRVTWRFKYLNIHTRDKRECYFSLMIIICCLRFTGRMSIPKLQRSNTGRWQSNISPNKMMTTRVHLRWKTQHPGMVTRRTTLPYSPCAVARHLLTSRSSFLWANPRPLGMCLKSSGAFGAKGVFGCKQSWRAN